MRKKWSNYFQWKIHMQFYSKRSYSRSNEEIKNVSEKRKMAEYFEQKSVKLFSPKHS